MHVQPTAELFSAISKFQGKVVDLLKDTQGYGYNYADLAQALQIVRPLAAEFGLSITQWPVSSEDGTRVGVETLIAHSSGGYIQGDPFLMGVEKSKNLSLAQAAGMIITYCRRYSVAATLGLAQDDNDAASGLANAPKPTKPEATPEQVSAFLTAATTATSPDDVRAVYAKAKAANAPQYLLDQIVSIGRELKTAAASPKKEAAPASEPEEPEPLSEVPEEWGPVVEDERPVDVWSDSHLEETEQQRAEKEVRAKLATLDDVHECYDLIRDADAKGLDATVVADILRKIEEIKKANPNDKSQQMPPEFNDKLAQCGDDIYALREYYKFCRNEGYDPHCLDVIKARVEDIKNGREESW